jgi:hypothetical protein
MSPIVHLVLANAALWRRWNSEIEQARRAYYGGDNYGIDYAKRTAASEKQMRYQRRKKKEATK